MSLVNLLSQTDPLNNATTYAYDNLYRNTTLTDPLSGVTIFTYDLANNLTSLTDPVGNTTVWTYDGLNRVIAETNELDATRTFSYDAAGNLLQKIDRNGRHTQYAYDGLQRRVEEHWLDPADDTTVIHTIDWTYDLADQLTAVEDTFAHYEYTYDDLGQTTALAASLAGLSPTVTLAQAFDANGRRTQLAATIGTTADFQNDYTFDALNRLTRITQQDVAGGNMVAPKRIDFTYLADGQFETITRYADLPGTQLVATSAYTYDAAGRLAALEHAQGASVFAAYAWTYDAASRITAFANGQYSAEDATYTYDDASQLIAADRDGSTHDEAYAYDANGNRENIGYTTGTNNRMTSDGTYNYVYDDEGNRIRRIALVGGNPIGATTEYAYDHRNRQIQVIEKDSPTGAVLKQVDYTYDAFNRRITKTIDSNGAAASGVTEQFFIYDPGSPGLGSGQNIVLDLQDDGDVNHRYLYGSAIDQIFSADSGAGVLWGLGDNQNTIRDVVEYDSGLDTTSVANHLFYDAFGRVTSETAAAVDFLLGFHGMERDKETGTHHADNREYDPFVGLWTQEDNIGFKGGAMKLDEFVGNSPTNYTDPSGLLKIKLGGYVFYVHRSDPDPRPSRPHAHVGNPNSSLKVHIETGELFENTRATGKNIGKKTLATLRQRLRDAGLLGLAAIVVLETPGIVQAAEEAGLCGVASHTGDLAMQTVVATGKAVVIGGAVMGGASLAGTSVTATAGGATLVGVGGAATVGGVVLVGAGVGGAIGYGIGSIPIGTHTIHEHLGEGLYIAWHGISAGGARVGNAAASAWNWVTGW